MAIYTVNGMYIVRAVGDSYETSSSYINFRPSSITNNNENEFFTVGETVYDISEPEFLYTIRAFTTDGVVISNPDLGQILFTNNTEYPNGGVLATNANPFPVCFVKGTLIDTDRGAVAVEALAIGDQVVCSNGIRTVKWIGWRHYHAVALRSPEQRVACTPVRILAGALGDNQPSQDLRVSPWHHLYVDGVLVRANDLINGKSIVQETAISEFSYYHVELDQFDVIRAHGVYSESWADGGNRDFFQNVDVTTLRPEDKKRRLADRPGFTVLRKSADIAVIRARIAGRADSMFATATLKAA